MSTSAEQLRSTILEIKLESRDEGKKAINRYQLC